MSEDDSKDLMKGKSLHNLMTKTLNYVRDLEVKKIDKKSDGDK